MPLALVTGATGFIGAALVPALLERGWDVRVLVRTPSKLPAGLASRVEIVEGDATSPDVLRRACAGVDAAYFLLHSMEGAHDFARRDRELATSFAEAARAGGVRRIVYLGGLHPAGELSPHLASRVEVGEILAASGIPTAILQAGVILGRDSASYRMLRHLTERLPVAVGPKWLNNRIQPIALGDVVHFLVAAAELPDEVSRSFDLGMRQTMSYREMMRRYAEASGLWPRFIGTVPVLTPELASHWVGLVTPVDASIARPLVGSLVHDAVRAEFDAEEILGTPPGGGLDFAEAVALANADDDPKLWGRTFARVAAGVAACAVAGSVTTDPGSSWYGRLRKPSWQPPPPAFPIVWTSLYAAIAVAATTTIHELIESGRRDDARAFARALAANLVLNAGWSGVFFRARHLPTATAVAALLAASSWDLARRASATGPGKALGLGAYAAWCTFATVLTETVRRLNR